MGGKTGCLWWDDAVLEVLDGLRPSWQLGTWLHDSVSAVSHYEVFTSGVLGGKVVFPDERTPDTFEALRRETFLLRGRTLADFINKKVYLTIDQLAALGKLVASRL